MLTPFHFGSLSRWALTKKFKLTHYPRSNLLDAKETFW